MAHKSLVVIFCILALPIAGFVLGSLVTSSQDEVQLQEAMADPGTGIKYYVTISDSVSVFDIANGKE